MKCSQVLELIIVDMWLYLWTTLTTLNFYKSSVFNSLAVFNLTLKSSLSFLNPD